MRGILDPKVENKANNTTSIAVTWTGGALLRIIGATKAKGITVFKKNRRLLLRPTRHSAFNITNLKSLPWVSDRFPEKSP
jgi:hypothetical protein